MLANIPAAAAAVATAAVVDVVTWIIVNLAVYSFTIGRITDRRQERANACNELCSLIVLCKVQASLNHIIGIRVTQKLVHIRMIDYPFNQQPSCISLSNTNTLVKVCHDEHANKFNFSIMYLFNHIGTKLLNRQFANRLNESTYQVIRIGCIAQLQHILYDVVPKRVLHQRQRMVCDHIH